MRLSVSLVMRLPSRNRFTSLPSLTARRPNVDSAISAWRQNSAIWLRISWFFIGGIWGDPVGSGGLRAVLSISCPLLGARFQPISCSAMTSVSFLRKQEPILRGLAVWRGWVTLLLQETLVVMGPRVRGDDERVVCAPSSSLRAERSNPSLGIARSKMDCFVASLLAMTTLSFLRKQGPILRGLALWHGG